VASAKFSKQRGSLGRHKGVGGGVHTSVIWQVPMVVK
jgi:hypothetical protein